MNHPTDQQSCAASVDVQSPVSRRGFLYTAAGTTLAATAGVARSAAAEDSIGSAAKIKQGGVILFQGDSITDAGRSRKRTGANDTAALGRGYPMLLASALLSQHPTAGLKIYNRGISGNKVPDLMNRWQADAIDLKPDVLSILIGVNDIWHKLAGRYKGTVKDYETGYRQLIQRTLKDLPDVRIVICQPFVLRCGAVNDKWFPEFDQRRDVAEKLAREFKLSLVPFQTMFDKVADQPRPQHWAGDGVHPTLAGHALMAATWRKVVGI